MQSHAECGKLRKQKEACGRVRKEEERSVKFKRFRLPKFVKLGNTWAPNSQNFRFCLYL